MDPTENRPRKHIPTPTERASLIEGEQHLVVERPQPNISVITINRPESNNMLTHRTRAQLFNQLQINDQDPDVRVTIIKGAGGNFCGGNDFDSNREVLPFFEPDIDGQTSRHVLNGWFMINDLAKPVVAMVEGEAIGGGLELAAACDVCICAEDATIGYNAIRGQGLSDYQILPWLCGMRNAMELILTNKPMTGIEAHKRGFATEAVPAAELEERTMNLALRIAKIPSDLLAFNKKSVHRAFEAQGMRTNLRNGVDLEALMFKAAGAKMLNVRRGPQRGKPAATRIPPPRPQPAASRDVQSVAAQAVSATSATAAPENAKAAPAPSAAKAPAAKAPAAKAPVATPVRPAAAAARPAVAKPAASPAAKPAAPVAAKPAAPVAAKPAATPVAAKPAATPVAAKSAATPVAAAAKPTARPAVAKPAAPAASTPAKPAAPVAAKPATPAATPVKKPVAAAPVTPAKTPAVAAASNEDEAEEDRSVQIHLHEAVHIHIVNSNTPSKL